MVHTVGATHWKNGLPWTGRGNGTPVLPPTVWLNTAWLPPSSGWVRSSGNSVGWKVTLPRAPKLTRVELM